MALKTIKDPESIEIIVSIIIQTIEWMCHLMDITYASVINCCGAFNRYIALPTRHLYQPKPIPTFLQWRSAAHRRSLTKCSKSDTALDNVSCGFSGMFSLTDPVRIESVHWRDNGFYRGCVQCRRKVDTKCSLHPDSGSKVYYRLRVLIRQGDVLLWLTAFDEIAANIMGTLASEYGSLDVLGRKKLVDSVVGLRFW